MSWRRLKLKIAVCDDEKFERDRIKDLICIYSVEKNIEIDVDFLRLVRIYLLRMKKENTP